MLIVLDAEHTEDMDESRRSNEEDDIVVFAFADCKLYT